jgi:hypothetical protein
MNIFPAEMMLIYLLSQLSQITFAISIGYPWNISPSSPVAPSTQQTSPEASSPASPAPSSHLLHQQAKILSKLSKMNLEILSDDLPSELLSGQSLHFTKNSSFLYSCQHASSPDSSQRVTHNETETLSLSKFQHLCFDFNVDWWSYQWCSGLEVKQYHLEMKGKKKTIKKPEWSLGIYEHTEYERDDFDHITKVKEYFSGGQICHENNHQRSSEVCKLA